MAKFGEAEKELGWISNYLEEDNPNFRGPAFCSCMGISFNMDLLIGRSLTGMGLVDTELSEIEMIIGGAPKSVMCTMATKENAPD